MRYVEVLKKTYNAGDRIFYDAINFNVVVISGLVNSVGRSNNAVFAYGKIQNNLAQPASH